jgi:hypothetical protein
VSDGGPVVPGTIWRSRNQPHELLPLAVAYCRAVAAGDRLAMRVIEASATKRELTRTLAGLVTYFAAKHYGDMISADLWMAAELWAAQTDEGAEQE